MDGMGGIETMCTKSLTVEFEHARTFARWDATITLNALARFTMFG